MMTKERDKEIKPDRKGGVIWPYVRGKKTRGIVRASPSNSAHTTRDLDKKPRAAYMCSQATNNFRKKTTTKNAGHDCKCMCCIHSCVCLCCVSVLVLCEANFPDEQQECETKGEWTIGFR